MKECNQCGKCCTKYGGDGLSVSDEEIDLWETFRPDLYEFVQDGEIWINPNTGEQLSRCPWLRKVRGQDRYTCDIYLEVQDLANPKRAQDKLNRIMADSRPPFEP